MQIRDINIIDVICSSCTDKELEKLKLMVSDKLDIVLTINGEEFDFEHMVLDYINRLKQRMLPEPCFSEEGSEAIIEAYKKSNTREAKLVLTDNGNKISKEAFLKKLFNTTQTE